MARQMSRMSRRELVAVVGGRYRESSPEEKRRILTEFVAVTGYHRKHAIRLLNGRAEIAPRVGGQGRPRLYDEAVREALVMLWEASDRVCGKRLKPLMAILIPALENHGHLHLHPDVRHRLLSVSAATIDRLLSPTRLVARGGPARPRSGVPSIRSAVPVRTFGDWEAASPGYMEADLVAHCGDHLSGSFVHTLVLTDVATGWTECIALVVREGALVVEALTRLRATLPFRLVGFDTDNGTEFLNETVLKYCATQQIEFTRSRPYRKNDQAWVEQKNGAIVRRLVGYRRLEGLAAAEALTRLYAASRLFVNFFQPSFKLAAKTRFGARVRKRYHAPETPCSRLLSSDAVPDGVKDRLRGVAAVLDPLRLLDEIRTVQHQVAGMERGVTPHVVPHRDADLDSFLESLSTAWRDGEVRPTHREQPKPRRYWRTRKDPFENVWPLLRGWLAVDPDRTAVQLLERLQEDKPGEFCDGHLRTLQRRVKAWRSARARELVFGNAELQRAANAHLGLVAPAAPGAIPSQTGGNIQI